MAIAVTKRARVAGKCLFLGDFNVNDIGAVAYRVRKLGGRWQHVFLGDWAHTFDPDPETIGHR